MNDLSIRQAVPADERTILAILHSVQNWLHSCGHDQWPDGSPSLGPLAIARQIDGGQFWLVSSGHDPAACIALSRFGDIDFWTPRELAQPAVYLSKAAVLRTFAGQGLGALLLRWAADRAWFTHADAIRLDVWKTNTALQEYYRRQGWEYLRTEEAEGRNSGALFSRPSAPDPEARAAFRWIKSGSPGPVAPGTRVIVPADDGPVSATCLRVTSDSAQGSPADGWEHGEAAPLLYEAERDGRTWFTREAWPDPGVA